MSPAKPPFKTALGPLAAALAASLAGTILLAPRASAADLDPMYAASPQIQQQQMVTFGSGWYVRGDIAATDDTYKVGATQTSNPTISDVGIGRSQDAAYALSLGGGYAFTNSFRADVTADFFQPTQSLQYPVTCPIAATNNCALQGKFNHYDALINGYYDLGTWSIVTPYVGAGVGVGFGNVKTNILYDSEISTGYLGYHSFAWALMAGLAFDVYPHVKIDIGYRYISEGEVYGVKVYENEIRAGLRYMIDN